MKTTATASRINGIDVDALGSLVEAVKADDSRGIARFAVTSTWKGGTRTDSHVRGWELGGKRLKKSFTISIDEPQELLGSNAFANPQEYLLAAVNACILATYVAACSVNGITLERLEIETSGQLDLRGFLAIDAAVKPGYEQLDFVVRIKGDGTPRQFEDIHKFVQRTSPNYDNMASAIRMNGRLLVE